MQTQWLGIACIVISISGDDIARELESVATDTVSESDREKNKKDKISELENDKN